jgi:hypothetical protein
MSNKMQNTDDFLDELFETVFRKGAHAQNVMLLRSQEDAVKQAISERIAAERVEAEASLASWFIDELWDAKTKPEDIYPMLEAKLKEIKARRAALTPQVSEGEKT